MKRSMYDYANEILQIPLCIAGEIPENEITEHKKFLACLSGVHRCLVLALKENLDSGLFIYFGYEKEIRQTIKEQDVNAICIEDCLLNKSTEVRNLLKIQGDDYYEMFLELTSTKNHRYLDEIQFMDTPIAWKKEENNFHYRSIKNVIYRDFRYNCTTIDNFFRIYTNLLGLFPQYTINIIERDFFNLVKKYDKDFMMRHLKNNVVKPYREENNPLNIHIRYFGKNKLEDFQIDRLVTLFKQNICSIIWIFLKKEKINKSVTDFFDLVHTTRKAIVEFYDLIYIPNTTASLTFTTSYLDIEYDRYEKESPSFKIDRKTIRIYPDKDIDTFLQEKEVIQNAFT